MRPSYSGDGFAGWASNNNRPASPEKSRDGKRPHGWCQAVRDVAVNQWLRERVRPTVKLYWTELEGAPEMLPPCPARSSAEQTRFALPDRHIGRVPQHAYSKPTDLPTKQVQSARG